MNATTCLQLLREIKSVSFATVDTEGLPQVRIIDVMIVEDEKLYFCTSRGKDFYHQLIADNHVAITGMNKDYQMIRFNGRAHKLDDQKYWIDRIFESNPVMNSVYPGASRYILEPFCMDNGNVEFFDLGQVPIVRESFKLGNSPLPLKGFEITDNCIQCGKCERLCPQKCIENFTIQQSHCLHCGLCFEQCPVNAVVKRGE